MTEFPFVEKPFIVPAAVFLPKQTQHQSLQFSSANVFLLLFVSTGSLSIWLCEHPMEIYVAVV